MSLTPAMIDAMVAAGATPEVLAAAFKAELLESETKAAEKRAKDAERKRASRLTLAASRNVTVTSCDIRGQSVTSCDTSPPSPSPSSSPPTPPLITTPSTSPSPAPSLRSGVRTNDDWPADFREQFWLAYPKRVGKLGALRKLEVVRKSGVPWGKLIEAVRGYAATADPQFTKDPKTWLHNGCWDDERRPPPRANNAETPKRSTLTAALDEHIRRFRGSTGEDDPSGGVGEGPPRLLSHG